MEASKRVRLLQLVLVVVISSWFLTFVSADDELLIDVAQPRTLQMSSGKSFQDSPGSKPGVIMVGERVRIVGLSRLNNLKKYAHSVNVQVRDVDSGPGSRPRNVDVCFHRNISLGIGMCNQSKWEKLIKGSWIRYMSPYETRLLDIRMPGPSFTTIEVSIEEEFVPYRIMFLAIGIILLMLAPALSKSIVFYYSSAMAVGVILVVLMVLFQGMRLLPTGRKNSLAVFMYSCFVGLGSIFLRYIPGLLKSALLEIGISEDLYYPLSMVLLVCVILAGAWLGFWAVRKLVLTEDGSIDLSTSVFVAWSIRIFSAALIFQSSLDPLLAAEALLCGFLLSAIMRKVAKLRFLRHVYRNLWRKAQGKHKRSRSQDSPIEDSHDYYLYNGQRSEESMLLKRQTNRFTLSPCNSPTEGNLKTPGSRPSGSGSYFSTFHNTPERQRFSKEEWELFTKDSTKKALQGLVASPDFNKWAVANAERITLTPTNDQSGNSGQRRRWFSWF